MIVLVGHSYVRRLQRFCEGFSGSGFGTARSFATNAVDVSWCGVGGATVSQYANGNAERRFRRMVFGIEQADVIFIHIGENDIQRGVKAAELVHHIRRLVNELQAPGRIIYVGQLLPFPVLHRRRNEVL